MAGLNIRTIRLNGDAGGQEFAVGVRCFAVVDAGHGLGQRVEDKCQALVPGIRLHVHGRIRLATPVFGES